MEETDTDTIFAPHQQQEFEEKIHIDTNPDNPESEIKDSNTEKQEQIEDEQIEDQPKHIETIDQYVVDAYYNECIARLENIFYENKL